MKLNLVRCDLMIPCSYQFHVGEVCLMFNQSINQSINQSYTAMSPRLEVAGNIILKVKTNEVRASQLAQA